MILNTFSEKEILDELCLDYKKNIKPFLKKQAKKNIAEEQRKGKIMRGTLIMNTLTSSLHNKWSYALDIDMTKKVQWRGMPCCIVESEYGTKDYYIIRGLSEDKPYFMKFSAHTIKRLRERNMFHKIETPFVPCLLFRAHENLICTPYVGHKEMELLKDYDDVEEIADITYYILAIIGAFMAIKSPEGNFHIKTYITGEMSISGMEKIGKRILLDKESNLTLMSLILHQNFNKKLYTDEDLSLLRNYCQGEKEINIEKSITTVLRP